MDHIGSPILVRPGLFPQLSRQCQIARCEGRERGGGRGGVRGGGKCGFPDIEQFRGGFDATFVLVSKVIDAQGLISSARVQSRQCVRNAYADKSHGPRCGPPPEGVDHIGSPILVRLELFPQFNRQ